MLIPTTGVRVEAARVVRLLDELSRIGADEHGGVTRLGFSAEDRQARDFVADFAARIGLSPEVDAAGNLIIAPLAGQMGVPRCSWDRIWTPLCAAVVSTVPTGSLPRSRLCAS